MMHYISLLTLFLFLPNPLYYMIESNEDVQLSSDNAKTHVIVREGGLYIHVDKLTAESVEMIMKMRDELRKPGPRFVDYSQSHFKKYLAHPEYVNKIMTWLHLHIDGHEDAMLKLKPLRALILCKAFSGTLPKKVFEKEFGEVDQSTYSKCIGDGNKFDTNEVNLLIESFNSFDYVSYVRSIL